MPKNAQSLAKLCDAAIEVWLDLEVELVNKLIDSMPRRITALRKARGWYTKY
jgi:hypothetical protein